MLPQLAHSHTCQTFVRFHNVSHVHWENQPPKREKNKYVYTSNSCENHFGHEESGKKRKNHLIAYCTLGQWCAFDDFCAFEPNFT